MIVPVSIASGWVGMFVLSGLCWLTVPGLSAETPESAFRSTLVRITAMPDAVDVPVEWEYTNPGDFPLVIEKLSESCGCLKGSMNPKGDEAIAPGKSGVIHAAFTPGAYRGLLRKSIHVRFAGHEKPVELVLEATVPKSVELSASELSWAADAQPAPQSLDITSGTDTDFNLTGLGGVTDKQFRITRETLEEKRHHRITVTPAEGVPTGVHTLLVRTDSPDSRDRVIPVFLHVR